MKLSCPQCRKTYKSFRYTCECGSILMVEGNYKWKPSGDGVWRYKSMLPSVGKPVTLDEGNTGLAKSERLGYKNLYFKNEGDNPTDSFKDRGTTVVVSHAKKRGEKRVAVASTGNMGASVAAYAAHAGIIASVYVPADTPREKLAQILAHGGKLVRVRGTFRDCVAAAKKSGAYLAMTGLNPYYVEGEKTVGYEIFEDIGVPDKIVVPMGTGGLTTAIFKAFMELGKKPEMIGVQAKGCSPIVDSFKEGNEEIVPAKKPKTISGAIMVKTPFNGVTALRAIKKSGGTAVAVSDKETIAGIKALGRDGIFAEPASATTVAALNHIDARKDEKIVLVITGHGLKQPKAIL